MREVNAIVRAPGLRHWRSCHELRAYQEGRLRRLVAHAYGRVPYYRDLFDRHGLRPDDIRSVDDLSVVPVSGKADLRHLPSEQVLARGVGTGRPQRLQTTGSTGVPFVLHRGLREKYRHQLIWLRAQRSARQRPGERTARSVAVRANGGRAQGRAGAWLTRLGLRNQMIEVVRPTDEILAELVRSTKSSRCAFGWAANVPRRPAPVGSAGVVQPPASRRFCQPPAGAQPAITGSRNMAEDPVLGERSKARIGEEKVIRGQGGELHQVAGKDTPVLTTAQGIPVSGDQNSLRLGMGALLKLVAPNVGGIEASDGTWLEGDEKIDGGPSVLFDAMAILPSAQGATLLAGNSAPRDFVADAFAHFKFIGHHSAAEPLLSKAGLDSAERDGGCLRLDRTEDVAAFLTACRELRFWQREPTMAKG
ncbi:MAG: hypothetical protein AB7I59_25600 [Geminicoccaceae bacterium]